MLRVHRSIHSHARVLNTSLANPQLSRRRLLSSESTRKSPEAVLERVAEIVGTPSGVNTLARKLDPKGPGLNELRRALSASYNPSKQLAYDPIGPVSLGSQASQVDPTAIGRRDFGLLVLESGVPFVGFGLIDNAGMLVFGDYIDVTLGVRLGVSTLASAALGNMLSDVLGLQLGGAVQALAAKLGLPTAQLTLEQTTGTTAKYARQLGSTIGIIIGCLLGCFPLLFLDPHKSEKLKRKRRIENLFGQAINFVADALDAESATLFVVDKGELWTRASKELTSDVRLPLTTGLVGRCVRTGYPVVSNDVYRDPDFNAEIDQARGTTTASTLCMPVFDRSGSQVIGAIEVINKRSRVGFTVADERVLELMASHVSIALEHVREEESADEEEDDARLLKSLQACTSHRTLHMRFESERSLAASAAHQEEIRLRRPERPPAASRLSWESVKKWWTTRRGPPEEQVPAGSPSAA